MRFSSSYRVHQSRAKRLCFRGSYRLGDGRSGWRKRGANVARLLRVCVLLLLGGGMVTGPQLQAQPPGTIPDREILDQQNRSDQEGLPIRAMMFLSVSGNPVLMPTLTWEEFERRSELDSGADANRQAFSYQSLSITGDTDQERAELDVELRLTIAPTDGRWVSIPLRMGNFHQLAPPEVSDVDEHFMTLAPDASGHLLFVKTAAQREVLVRMRVAARVEVSSAARSLEFRLPDVPAQVNLRVDAENITGDVVGRGDEAIMTASVAGRRTKFTVDSGGGNFSMRWGSLARSKDNLPLLEVESRVTVRWDLPEDQPIASVRLTVKNVRGSIDSFQLRLPSGSVMLESPRLGTSGQTIELGAATNDREGEIREVLIPEEERQSRIDLNFDLQLANDNASATSPLSFRVPEVVGSLRQRGEIEIRTAGDSRLRWLTQSWVRSELEGSRDESTTGRTYRFRFDRASFDLSLWLGEKEHQLRMTSESKITVRESLASLDMTIQINGQIPDGRLQFDDAGWQINAIQNQETGESLDSFADAYRVIEMNSGGSDDSVPIRVLAELPLGAGDDEIRFGLPKVMNIDDTALVHQSSLDIINSGRAMLVVDLEASTGLTRIAPTNLEPNAESTISSFRVQTQDAATAVVGTMIEQSPRIVLGSDATIELDGDQLRTTVDWTVTSGFDLEGALPIRIPESIPLPSSDADEDTSVLVDDTEGDSKSPLSTSDPWIVTVDGLPARLRPLGNDRYELISDRLARGTMSIRWRQVQNLRSERLEGAVVLVSMPRPNIADVTVRGVMQVTLRGNQQLDLVSAETQPSRDLALETLPRDPLRLKLQTRRTAHEDLTVRQTILRTVVGRSIRHEQVLAKIQGGESFRVGLPETAQDVSVEAFIDDAPVTVRRDGNTLSISLNGDMATHVIDLRVWMTLNTPSAFAKIEPTLQLPVGVGRVFWQIVTPLDGHVVWASPTLGRSMVWRFDGWKLDREPSHDDRALLAMAGVANKPRPPGNRYLYIGSDLRSFEVVVVSRVVLWILIGSVVLCSAVMLTNFPSTRHPLTAVVLAVLFGGLLAIAPDAAVLAGQFGIIALVLVVVMMAIRAMITPSRSDRVFASSPQTLEPSKPPSTRSLKQVVTPGHTGTSSTQALPPPSPTEVSP